MASSVPGGTRWPGVVAVPLVVATLLWGLLGPVAVAGAASTGLAFGHAPASTGSVARSTPAAAIGRADTGAAPLRQGFGGTAAAAAATRRAGATADEPAYAPTLSGKAVHFGLSGFEPDFDPIYQLTVQATLHDRRPAALALPDATLILSAYLESFTPDTTPTLPDLLHPDTTATALGGFLQGKSALVNAAGRTVYKGSLLAEIFQDGTEHLLVDLYPAGGDPNAAPVRLQGILTLAKGGAESGSLRALTPLSRAALAVPRGAAPSWQSVVAGLSVSRPQMMGTAGSAPGGGAAPARAASAAVAALRPAAPLRGVMAAQAPRATDGARATLSTSGSTSRPAPPPATASPALPPILLGLGAGLLGAALLAGWRRRHRRDALHHGPAMA